MKKPVEPAEPATNVLAPSNGLASGELSQADKEFLKRDVERRQRRDTGRDKIEQLQQSDEVAELLRETDEIEKLAANYRPAANRLLDDVRSFLPLDIAVGPGLCSGIMELFEQLRIATKAENCRHIHERVEALGIAATKNRTVTFIGTLAEMVRNHRETTEGIRRNTEALREEIKGYVERKKRLAPGAAIGIGEAQEGTPPEPDDEPPVKGNLPPTHGLE